MRRDFRSRRKRKLAGDNNGLVRLDTALDNGKIAVLALTWFHGSKIDSVVRLTTKTNGPLWLTCTACDGTSLAFLSMSRMKRTRTNSDGHSARSGFGVTPRDFHRSGAGLHCVVDKIQIAHARRDRP